MYRVLSSEPTTPTDGHLDLDFEARAGWAEDLGATVLAMMLGDDVAGPLVVLSHTAAMTEQMPLSFAHAHASDNWRISVRGTTNMGKDAYAQGQFRFHDGGVPYASDNFAWGPDGGFGIIMFADRRGFAINPVKAELAEKIGPQQQMVGEALGIDVQDPCPGAPAIATTLGPTERAHRNGGFDEADTWAEATAGVRVATALLGEPSCGPVILLVDCAPGVEALPARALATEVVVAPVSGAALIGHDALEQGDVRLEESAVEHGPIIAGDDGLQLAVIVADRRALRDALDDGTFAGPLARALAPTLAGLHDELVAAR